MTDTTQTLDAAVINASTTKVSFMEEAVAATEHNLEQFKQGMVEPAIQPKIEKEPLVVPKEEYKSYSCRTQNIRACFSPATPHSHEKGRFSIATGDGSATVQFNGRAARSLYLMLKQAFE